MNSPFKIRRWMLLALSLSPVGALAWIIAGPMLRTPDLPRGFYNGTPFSVELRRSSLPPVRALNEVQASLLAGGGRLRPEFEPWRDLVDNPLLHGSLSNLLPGTLVSYRDGSLAGAFAMPDQEAKGGSLLAILRTQGPLKAGSSAVPGGALLEIRYGPLLARKYPPQGEETLTRRLVSEGWREAPRGKEGWRSFQKDSWTALAGREQRGYWSFFAYEGGL